MLRNSCSVLSDDTCFGCFACADACPKNCISQQPNDEGFLFPVVDEAICVDCRRCESVCPVIHPPKCRASEETYAAQAKNTESLLKSASGGVFGTIAQKVLLDGGVVYGCTMIDCAALHIRIDDVGSLDALRGSRYIQSNASGCYSLCKKDLINGKRVVYCGTPCQIAALLSFLGEEYENLLTIDLVCHGVGSPGLFEECKRVFEKRSGKRIIDVNFRSKRNGWGLTGLISAYDSKGSICELDYHSQMHPYYHYYLAGDDFRDCCYSCRYANEKRVGDITAGDFWGIQIVDKSFPNIDMGVSVLSINKVEKWASLDVEKLFYLRKQSYQTAAMHNEQMIKPSIRKSGKKHSSKSKIEAFYKHGKVGRLVRLIYYHMSKSLKGFAGRAI